MNCNIIMKTLSFWKPVTLQLLHRHTLNQINFLDALHNRDRERACFQFFLNHRSGGQTIILDEKLPSKTLLTLSFTAG